MDDDGTANIWKGLVQKINVSVQKNVICSGSYYESEGRIQYSVETSQQDLGSSEQFLFWNPL
jgi:hypothetical protein